MVNLISLFPWGFHRVNYSQILLNIKSFSMKKILLNFAIVLFLTATTQLSAQSHTTHTVLADFENGFPENMTLMTGNHDLLISTESWEITQIYNGNSIARTSSASSDSWLVLSDVKLFDVSKKVRLDIDLQKIDVEPSEVQIFINRKNSLAAEDFELIETLSDITDKVFDTYSINLSDYAGEIVSIGLRSLQGGVALDDIILTEARSISSVKLNVRDSSPYGVLGGNQPLIFNHNIRNTDKNPVNSITYEISNGDESVEASIEGLNIETFKNKDLSLEIPQSVLRVPGVDLEIKIIKINEEEVEEAPVSMAYSVIDAAASKKKLALAEMFTSSSCPPCKPGNEHYQDVVDNQLNEPVHYIKLQQDFPGNGDPYTTDELIQRRSYYRVNAVPELHIDGIAFVDHPGSLNVNNYKDVLNQPRFVTFKDVVMTLDSQTVTVTGTYTMLSRVLEDTKLMAAIVEDTTYKNATTNGERVFLHVVKKFIGGNEGHLIDEDTPLHEPQEFELTYTFNGDYRLPQNGLAGNRINNRKEHSVEDFDNLSVSVWMENQDSKFILNSASSLGLVSAIKTANLMVNTVKVYPVPADNHLRVEVDLDEYVDAEISIINMSGQRVMSLFSGGLNKGVNTISGQVSDLSPGQYIVELRGRNLYHGTPILIVR